MSDTTQPIWTDDALNRLLGARDGYIHALLALGYKIGEYDGPYTGRFPERHRRKIAQRNAVTKPLRELVAQLEEGMRRCQEVYKREYERAHPRRSAPQVSSCHDSNGERQ